MADVESVRHKINEIAQKRKNVTLKEIKWVVEQLRDYFPVSVRRAKHGRLFSVGSKRFTVSSHNPGSKQVKSCYVDAFIDAMTELGWYEE